MSGDHLLAIDQGTQSARALVFDLRGNLVAKARAPIEPYFSDAPGLAEQHAHVFWDAVCRACQSLWSEPGVSKDRIAGVALTTQRSTVLNIDRDGSPLRPAISWLDQRRTEGLPPVGGAWGALFRLAGMSGTVAYLQAEAEANWIRTHQPEIWSKTHKYLLLSGYLTYRLTGRFVDSVGCQVGYIPFDYKGLHWSKRWDWKWQALPMDAALLPDLVVPTQPLGEITPAAAEATGIPVGLPLIAAAADKACEVIGAGALEPHIGCLSYGTAATINTTHRTLPGGDPASPALPFRRAGCVQPGGPDLPRLLDGELVQARVRAARTAHRRRARGGAGGVVRRAGARRAARFRRPGAPTVLVARPEAPRPGSARCRNRIRCRTHASPPVPRHPRRPGVCASGGRRAHLETQRCSHHRAARRRRRKPERCRPTAHRRCLRPPGLPPACLRGLRIGRRHGRRRRPGPALRFSDRSARNDAPRANVRAGPAIPPHVRRPVPAGVPAHVRPAASALRQHSQFHAR